MRYLGSDSTTKEIAATLMVTNTAMLVYRPRRQEEGLSNTMNTFCLHRE